MSAAAPAPDQIQLLQAENAVLRAQIEWLKKQLFGGGKSERFDRAQLLLQLDALEKLASPANPALTITYQRAATSAPGARTLPAETFAHLPVEQTLEIVPPEVKAEPEAYEKIGEERTFEVEIAPPRLFKREIVRPKYRHRRDKSRPPLLAPAPKRAVPGGYASAGLLAWVAVAKYLDHLPLYRQEKMLARWGAPISRQTLCTWIAQVAIWLEPLHRCLHRELLEGGYVQVDETPVRCHDPDENRGQTVQGWLWVLGRPGSDVVFFWRLTRRHGELPPLLDGYRGLLQSDGYEAYPAFARDHAEVTWLGCWAHARRKFHEALAESPARAGFVLRLIGQLYHWENLWDARRVGPAARAALRQSQFALTLHLLHRLAAHLRTRVLPKSLLGQACGYLLSHWAPLVAHLDTAAPNSTTTISRTPSALRP